MRLHLALAVAGTISLCALTANAHYEGEYLGMQDGRAHFLCNQEATPFDTVANCGGCGVQCHNGEVCNSGQCECRQGLTRCGEKCVDIMNDDRYCGSCDNSACLDQNECINGGCGLRCDEHVKASSCDNKRYCTNHICRCHDIDGSTETGVCGMALVECDTAQRCDLTVDCPRNFFCSLNSCCSRTPGARGICVPLEDLCVDPYDPWAEEEKKLKRSLPGDNIFRRSLMGEDVWTNEHVPEL